jgi:hypothetical protein
LEDVFQYDDLPGPFRVQVGMILEEALGDDSEAFTPTISNNGWRAIHSMFIREKGVRELYRSPARPGRQLITYLQECPRLDALDLIDLAFRLVDKVVRTSNPYEREQYTSLSPDDAIKALHLLQDGGKQFSGPLQEFLDAHKSYRAGDSKNAIANAGKAFESTMKAICTPRGGPFDPNKDTAKRLIDIVFENELIPAFLQGQFSSLRAVLESGVPTLRNRKGGHGQGPEPIEVPDYLVSYAMHLTASNIVLLIQAHKALK